MGLQKVRLRLFVVASFGFLPLFSAQAQFVQQGNKLVGTGAAFTSGNCNISVSLSHDGNTALVGRLYDGEYGATWVFTRSEGTWSQEGDKLVGTGGVWGPGQGVSVALSYDGNTALIGGWDDNYWKGAVWVFTRENGKWTQQGEKLVDSLSEGQSQLGYSVALSADGNTALVGGIGSYYTNTEGGAWVFTRSNGVWNQQGNKLVGTGAVGTHYQGSSVALSADGNTALVGGPAYYSYDVGAVWVFTRANDAWTQQGEKLVGKGTSGTVSGQGTSISISGDGNTALVGTGSGGLAYMFTRSNGAWTQLGDELHVTGQEYPWADPGGVSLSYDGKTALLGCWGDKSYVGAVWVYTRTNDSWTQQGNKLVGTGAVGAAGQGYRVALSADGNTALVGGPIDSSGFGAAWVFTRTGTLPVVILPGIEGSALYNDKNNDNALAEAERVWVEPSIYPSDNLLQLQLNETGTAPLNPNDHIKSAPFSSYTYQLGLQGINPVLDFLNTTPLSSYGTLVQTLQYQDGYVLHDNDATYSSNENLYVFSYDWRKSITQLGGDLGVFLDKVMSTCGSNMVDVVAHSMGGLLAKSYIRNGGQGIQKLIFVGTPHLGAPKSIYVALTGDILLASDIWQRLKSTQVPARTVKTIGRNFPSQYQLFPFKKYCDLSLDNKPFGMVVNGDLQTFNYEETIQNFKTRWDAQTGLLEFNSGLLDNSVQFQNDFTDVQLGNTKAFAIAGYEQPTINSVVIQSPQIKPLMLVWGDGTVPVQSAKAVSSLSSFTKVYLRGGMHDNLCSNPDVVQTISNILKNGIPKASTPLDSVSDELVTSYQITASGNVFLHAYDSLTNHTGASSDTTSEANIPGSFYYRGGGDDSSMISILVLPRKPGYKIRVDSVKNSVPITLDVDDITAGRDVSFLDYRDIQLSSMGFATLSLDSVYADVSLKLDVHGDGSDVRIVPPSNFVVNAIRNRQSLTGEAPQGFALRQNYPNPFNPSTTIKYDLPKASLVWLSVFDILGRQVSVLVNERRDAGVHEVKFDGSNLASGVYFYQLKAGDFVATKRLLLLK